MYLFISKHISIEYRHISSHLVCLCFYLSTFLLSLFVVPRKRWLQDALDAAAWSEEPDGANAVMGDATSSKLLQPQILQLFASMHHADLYVRTWGAQNLPMKLEPAPSPSQRIYTCRHAVFAKHGTKRSKFAEEHAKQVPCAAIWIPLPCSFRSHWVDWPHC